MKNCFKTSFFLHVVLSSKTLQAAFWLVCLESGKQRNEENMLFSTNSLQNSVNSGVLLFLLKAQTGR